MIAEAKKKYVGIKTIDGSRLLTGAKRVLDRLDFDDRAIIEKILSEPVEFVDNPAFHTAAGKANLEKSFEAVDPEISKSEARLLPIDIFEQGEKVLGNFKPLKNEQEVTLFLKLNYARYRIYKLIKERENKPLTMTMVPQVLRWRKEELLARSQITQANIPLVLAMAKRSKLVGVDFTELISEGNMALLRSIDKFDASRGFKFSTYACRAIIKSFARVALRTNRYRGRFPVEFDPDLEKGDFIEQRREDTKIYCMDRLRDILGNETSELSDVERRVLQARFAIHKDTEQEKPMTLEQVGHVIGVTKERVRQIQNKALKKLRSTLEDSILTG